MPRGANSARSSDAAPKGAAAASMDDATRIHLADSAESLRQLLAAKLLRAGI